MSQSIDFQAQIASIMEVLANAAVAEICKVVDDGYAVVHLEMSQSHKENDFLKRKIKLMELQIAKLRAERRCQDGPLLNRFNGVQFLNRQNRDRAVTSLSMKGRIKTVDIRSHRISAEARAEKAAQVADKTKGTSDDMDDGEPDLLIIKEETLEEPKCLDQKNTTKEPSPRVEGAYEVDPLFLPAAAPLEPRTQDPKEEENVRDDRMIIAKAVKDENPNEPIRASEGSNEPGSNAEANNQHVNKGQDEIILPMCSKDAISDQVQRTGSKSLAAPQYKQAHWLSSPVEPRQCQPHFRERVSMGRLQGRGVTELDPHRSIVDPDVVIVDASPIDQDGNSQPHWHGDAQRNVANNQTQFSHQEYDDRDMQGPKGHRNDIHPHSQRERADVFDSDNYGMDMSTMGSFQDLCDGLDNASAVAHVPQHLSWTLADSENSPGAMHSYGSGRSFSCTLCGKRYLTVKQLKVHQKVHAGEKPFCCAQCGKRFIQLYSLKRHQRVHTGERPFRCAQCGKQFAHSSNLKVHQTVHTGEKNFHCTQCGKNFSFLSNLIRHQSIHAAK